MILRAGPKKLILLLFVLHLPLLSAALFQPTNVFASDWYEAAKSEKQVVWYTSLNVADNEKISAAFTKKYPGVDVNVNRQSANSVLQKVLTERRAGKDVADVVLVGAEYLDLLQTRGILQKYNSAEWKAEKGRFLDRDLHERSQHRLQQEPPWRGRGATALPGPAPGALARQVRRQLG